MIGSTAIAKGESLYDTARVLSGYSDAIVMRHPTAGSVREFASASRVPVINGGDAPLLENIKVCIGLNSALVIGL